MTSMMPFHWGCGRCQLISLCDFIGCFLSVAGISLSTFVKLWFLSIILIFLYVTSMMPFYWRCGGGGVGALLRVTGIIPCIYFVLWLFVIDD